MIRAKFSPRAQQDLEGIRNHIAEDNPSAAERVRATILDTADLLSASPAMATAFATPNLATRPFAGWSCQSSATI